MNPGQESRPVRTRGLKPSDALTLQQLQAKHANTPVFVVCLDKTPFATEPIQGWGLIRGGIVRLWHKCDLCVFDYHFEDYGKLWIAFDYCTDEKLIHDWSK